MKKTIFIFIYYFITVLLYAKEVQLAGSIINFENRYNDEAVIQMSNNDELTYYKLFMEKERLCVVKLIDIEKESFNPDSYELSMEAKNKANAFKLFLDLMDNMSEDGEIDFEKRIITNDLRQVLDGTMILNKRYLCIAIYDIAYHKTIFKIIDISKCLTRSPFSKGSRFYHRS